MRRSIKQLPVDNQQQNNEDNHVNIFLPISFSICFGC